jgi:hypothetical protein
MMIQKTIDALAGMLYDNITPLKDATSPWIREQNLLMSLRIRYSNAHSSEYGEEIMGLIKDSEERVRMLKKSKNEINEALMQQANLISLLSRALPKTLDLNNEPKNYPQVNLIVNKSLKIKEL